jgi:transposase
MKKICCKECREIEKLKEQIKKLRKDKQELLYEKRKLTQDIRELKGLIFKPDNRNKKEEDKMSPKKRGAPIGHPGKTRAKPEQIDEVIEVPVEKCSHCGSEELTRCARYDEHIQEDIVLPKVKATLYRHHFYYCRNCKKISKGIGKNEIPGSYIGPVAKSLANYMHYKSGLSYGKIGDFFERFFNLDTRKSSIYGFDNQAKRKGSGIYDDIREGLKDTPYLHVDETGWPNDGKNFWLWCMANEDLVFYHIDKRRNSTVVKEHIGNNYEGVVLSDFLSTYGKLTYLQQKCLVHLLRMTKRLHDRFPNSSRVRMFCGKLDKLTKKVITTRKGVEHIDKIRFLEIKGGLKSQIKTLLSIPLPYPAADKFRKRLEVIQQKLTVCLDLPYVPAHNNFVERQIRPNVILRKITFGTRSVAGIENHQTIMSLIQTAVLNKYPVLDLLKNIHSGQHISLAQMQNHSP